jgi:hypothetical protein
LEDLGAYVAFETIKVDRWWCHTQTSYTPH